MIQVNFQKRVTSLVIKTEGMETDSSSKDSLSSGCSGQGDQIYESSPTCKTRKHTINPNDLVESLSDACDYDENFSQAIEVELCENEGSPCSGYPTSKTKCKQRHISIQLQVVSRNTTLSELKTFVIPSNCQCVFYRS